MLCKSRNIICRATRVHSRYEIRTKSEENDNARYYQYRHIVLTTWIRYLILIYIKILLIYKKNIFCQYIYIQINRIENILLYTTLLLTDFWRSSVPEQVTTAISTSSCHLEICAVPSHTESGWILLQFFIRSERIETPFWSSA